MWFLILGRCQHFQSAFVLLCCANMRCRALLSCEGSVAANEHRWAYTSSEAKLQNFQLEYYGKGFPPSVSRIQACEAQASSSQLEFKKSDSTLSPPGDEADFRCLRARRVVNEVNDYGDPKPKNISDASQQEPKAAAEASSPDLSSNSFTTELEIRRVSATESSLLATNPSYNDENQHLSLLDSHAAVSNAAKSLVQKHLPSFLNGDTGRPSFTKDADEPYAPQTRGGVKSCGVAADSASQNTTLRQNIIKHPPLNSLYMVMSKKPLILARAPGTAIDSRVYSQHVRESGIFGVDPKTGEERDGKICAFVSKHFALRPCAVCKPTVPGGIFRSAKKEKGWIQELGGGMNVTFLEERFKMPEAPPFPDPLTWRMHEPRNLYEDGNATDQDRRVKGQA
ncbi:hypothetical protein P154DRAFT_529445 [Amniculicola lignicola CBS 123094]|uniref:Uncharacterized protein n=1 Tax=Amniculicola lignicola CBS 123094 TaxID=1392246 RepID=A0A6A5WYY0_9PLEO|nr:hypothetical protein P154DRAFT_529445 [Amniculicola lignicola CBS 123094]